MTNRSKSQPNIRPQTFELLRTSDFEIILDLKGGLHDYYGYSENGPFLGP